MKRRYKNAKYNARLIELDNVLKEAAANNPHIVEKGKEELKRIGISSSKKIYYFIRKMARVLGTSACRPATRYIDVAYYYIGEQYTTNREFHDMFKETVVNEDETIFMIGGICFDYNAKSKKRLKKSNVPKNIKGYKEKGKSHLFDTFVDSNEMGSSQNGPVDSYPFIEAESGTRPKKNGSCIYLSNEKDMFSFDFEKFDIFNEYIHNQ